MAVFDWKKTYKALYLPDARKGFHFVDVPAMNFLMMDGRGDPNTNPEYQETLNTLYSVAYTLKFALKPLGVEFSVPPLEGLWWLEGDMREFVGASKERWLWRMMIMLPPEVTAAAVDHARAEAAKKKDLPLLPRLRFEPFAEGYCAQVLYIGAYDDEGPTIAALHQFIRQNGGELRGEHHEIYLGDPRRTAPEKLKTVIRQPVKRL